MRANSTVCPYRLKLIYKKPKDFLISELSGQMNKHSAYLINALIKQNIKYIFFSFFSLQIRQLCDSWEKPCLTGINHQQQQI